MIYNCYSYCHCMTDNKRCHYCEASFREEGNQVEVDYEPLTVARPKRGLESRPFVES